MVCSGTIDVAPGHNERSLSKYFTEKNTSTEHTISMCTHKGLPPSNCGDQKLIGLEGKWV